MAVQHWVHLDGIEDGSALWRLECTHAPGGEWAARRDVFAFEKGRRISNDDCWLKAAWADMTGELLNIDQPIHKLPIPVRWAEEWVRGAKCVFLAFDGGRDDP